MKSADGTLAHGPELFTNTRRIRLEHGHAGHVECTNELLGRIAVRILEERKEIAARIGPADREGGIAWVIPDQVALEIRRNRLAENRGLQDDFVRDWLRMRRLDGLRRELDGQLGSSHAERGS